MKKLLSIFLMLSVCCGVLASCGNNSDTPKTTETDGTKIELSNSSVLIDGVAADSDNTKAVYVANDIVYYEEGHNFTYGEGEKTDEHSKEEADKHTVIHITKAGNYILSGKIDAGQIAVALGDEAETDPEAVVNLYLNGVEITNTVAPGVIFYNVYECGSTDTETAVKDVDTSKAGANVIIVDETTNTVNGSHVARIYEEGTVKLNEDGTEVEDADKLHKYDGAFYSKMSMNVNGGEKGTGKLYINADNEGLDTELHLTINGGNIFIESGNDGINTNEDGVSVTTINGGELHILVNGSTGEGDGIDSNGWLVINGGKVFSQACAFSGDAGIDSDMGIHINGGTVIASGNMLDRISESTQNYAVFTFNKFLGEGSYIVKNSNNEDVVAAEIENDFTNLIVSSADLTAGEYTLWHNDTQLAGTSGGNMGMGGHGFMGERPEDFDRNMEMPDVGAGQRPMQPADFEVNADGTITLPDGTIVNPEDMTDRFKPEKAGGESSMPTPPEAPSEPMGDAPTRPEDEGFGEQPTRPDGNPEDGNFEMNPIFTITEGGNYFQGIMLQILKNQ